MVIGANGVRAMFMTVKKLGDLKFRVPTQCCIKRNLFKLDGQVNMQVKFLSIIMTMKINVHTPGSCQPLKVNSKLVLCFWLEVSGPLF